MSSVTFPADAGCFEAELTNLYARLAAINQVIADLEKYAELQEQPPDQQPLGTPMPLAAREVW